MEVILMYPYDRYNNDEGEILEELMSRFSMHSIHNQIIHGPYEIQSEMPVLAKDLTIAKQFAEIFYSYIVQEWDNTLSTLLDYEEPLSEYYNNICDNLKNAFPELIKDIKFLDESGLNTNFIIHATLTSEMMLSYAYNLKVASN